MIGRKARRRSTLGHRSAARPAVRRVIKEVKKERKKNFPPEVPACFAAKARKFRTVDWLWEKHHVTTSSGRNEPAARTMR
jgi:hypothetical protein